MSYPHQRSADMINSCAQAFRVQVDDVDVRGWSAAFTMTKTLDTLVDEDHIYDSGMYTERLLAGEPVLYTTAEESAFLYETYAQLDHISQDRWQNAGRQLGAFALRRLAADTIDEYAAVVFDESYLMSDVLKVQNGDSRQDYEEREKFNAWMDQLSRTAFICDTLSDFIRDHNEGNVNIQPTLRGAARLGHYALRELRVLVPATPAPVYAAVARRAITKSVEKARRPGFWSAQFMGKRA